MSEKEPEKYCPTSRASWYKWLELNHAKKQSVWLVFYKKNAGKPTLTWSEAVDVALCFGWIDSKKQSIDTFSYQQFFCPRKPQSIWSKINKDKVEKLIESDEMQSAGLKSIEIARQNGSWTILDPVEALIVPDDLEAAFTAHPGSKEFYSTQSKSAKKGILYWVVSAKREETRQKRIKEIAELAAKGKKPKQF